MTAILSTIKGALAGLAKWLGFGSAMAMVTGFLILLACLAIGLLMMRPLGHLRAAKSFAAMSDEPEALVIRQIKRTSVVFSLILGGAAWVVLMIVLFICGAI